MVMGCAGIPKNNSDVAELHFKWIMLPPTLLLSGITAIPGKDIPKKVVHKKDFWWESN